MEPEEKHDGTDKLSEFLDSEKIYTPETFKRKKVVRLESGEFAWYRTSESSESAWLKAEEKPGFNGCITKDSIIMRYEIPAGMSWHRAHEILKYTQRAGLPKGVTVSLKSLPVNFHYFEIGGRPGDVDMNKTNVERIEGAYEWIMHATKVPIVEE